MILECLPKSFGGITMNIGNQYAGNNVMQEYMSSNVQKSGNTEDASKQAIMSTETKKEDAKASQPDQQAVQTAAEATGIGNNLNITA